jgi:acid phosphatase family membrane protein YuiD
MIVRHTADHPSVLHMVDLCAGYITVRNFASFVNRAWHHALLCSSIWLHVGGIPSDEAALITDQPCSKYIAAILDTAILVATLVFEVLALVSFLGVYKSKGRKNALVDLTMRIGAFALLISGALA